MIYRESFRVGSAYAQIYQLMAEMAFIAVCVNNKLA